MKPRYRSLPPPPPELSVFRDHTIALLRRYFCRSMEVGRLPAILGREIFPARCDHCHVHSFEDAVLFVIDVERCLDRLDPFDKELIARIVLQEYDEEKAARVMRCTSRTIRRRLPDALDVLTAMFLWKRILRISPEVLRCIEASQLNHRCHRRVPARAVRVASIVACGQRSQFEKSVVKPPFSLDSLEPAAIKENIFPLEVSGLPPSICYADFVS